MLDIIIMVASLSVMTVALNRANGVRMPFPHNIYVSMAAGIAAYVVLYSIVSAIYQMVVALFSSWGGILLVAIALIGIVAGLFFLIRRWREASDPFGSF